MNNKNIIESFYDYDLEIKNLIIKLSPEKYPDPLLYKRELLQGIKQLKITFDNLLNLLDTRKKPIEEKFNTYLDKLLACDRSLDELRDYYETNISTMDPKLNNYVQDNCLGYYLSKPTIANLIEKSTTVNEILHCIHAYVLNNEKIYQSVPKVKEKYNKNSFEKEVITLYGQDNEYAEEIFNNLPENRDELNIGKTDIVALDNRILMMVRDRGHALTIDIDTENADNITVNYLIPKICNMEMVKSIKEKLKNNGAINSSFEISSTAKTARGTFSTTKANLAKLVVSKTGLISMVPTDNDMILNKNSTELDKMLQENNPSTNNIENKKY